MDTISKSAVSSLPLRLMAADRLAAAGRIFVFLGMTSLAFMRPQLKIGALATVPTDVIFSLAACCWICAGALDRRWWVWHPFFALLAFYFLAMSTSVTYANEPNGKLYIKLASEIYLLALPVIIVGLFRSETSIATACRAWLIGVAALSAIALASFATAIISPDASWLRLVQHRLGSLSLGPFVRYRLAYENPNMLGAYLSLSLAIAMLAISRKWIPRLTGLSAIVLIGLMLVATFSAGIGGAMLIVAAWIAVTFERPKSAVVVALICVLALGAMAFVVAQIFTPFPSPGAWTHWHIPGANMNLYPSARWQVWSEAWDTFRAHPLTGVGLGNDVAHVRFQEPSGMFVRLYDGHNVALNIAAACGAPGLMALLLILLSITRITFSGIRDKKDGIALFALGLGLINVLIYQGVGGGFEDARFVWAALGLLLASAVMTAPSQPPRSSVIREKANAIA